MRRRSRSRQRQGWRARPLPVIVLILVAGFLAIVFGVRRDPEPTGLLLSAQRSLHLAFEQEAALEAPLTYELAERRVREGRSAMIAEFGKPAFFRDYGRARRLISEGHGLASRSLEEAHGEVQGRRTRIETEVAQIRAEAGEVRDLLQRLPDQHRFALRLLASAESRIWGAEAKLNAREGREALNELQIARGEVALALRDVHGFLRSFLGRRGEWSRDVAETLDWSRRNGGTAFLVDKLNHRGHLIRGGRTIQTFDIELGPHWMDRKTREGDRATPEGRYQVVRKKDGRQTKYHKALLLNYPNDKDSVLFSRLRAKGEIPRGARIGGMIEIHGGGGKGEDWTLGCVSLRNRDMDRLYGDLEVGSRVTIVGLWEEPTWLTRVMETASAEP